LNEAGTFGPNSPQAYTLFVTWLLIYVRIIGFFVQAPIWGSHHVSKPVLSGIAAIFAMVMFPNVHIPRQLWVLGAELNATNMVQLVPYIVGSFVTGLVLGYISFLIMAALQFGAELLDVQMGLSVAASFDPGQGSVNMIRRFMFYLAMILYLLMNGHYMALMAIKKSFNIVPLGGVTMSHSLINFLMEKTGLIFVLGLQIASPIVAALFITQVALGLLARVAPQMNVFMLSFPLNIMIGLTLLAASLVMLRERLAMLYIDDVKWMYKAMQLLIPVGGA